MKKTLFFVITLVIFSSCSTIRNGVNSRRIKITSQPSNAIVYRNGKVVTKMFSDEVKTTPCKIKAKKKNCTLTLNHEDCQSSSITLERNSLWLAYGIGVSLATLISVSNDDKPFVVWTMNIPIASFAVDLLTNSIVFYNLPNKMPKNITTNRTGKHIHFNLNKFHDGVNPFYQIGYPLVSLYSPSIGNWKETYKKCRWTGEVNNLEQPVGYGTAYFKDGSYFQGKVGNNKPNGYGIFKVPYKDTYNTKLNTISGNWINGKLNGAGIMSFDPYLQLEKVYSFKLKYVTGNYVNSIPKGPFYLIDTRNKAVGKTIAKNGKVNFVVHQEISPEGIKDFLIKAGVLAFGATAAFVLYNMGDISTNHVNKMMEKEEVIILTDPILDNKNSNAKRTYFTLTDNNGNIYKGIYKKINETKDTWHVDKSYYESGAETIAGALLIFPTFIDDNPVFHNLFDLKTYMIKLIKDKQK